MRPVLFALLPFVLMAQTDSSAPVAPITAAERLYWVIGGAALPTNILADAMAAGIGTGLDSPRELGPHWRGFQKRYFNDMATALLGNGMEAGLGALTGADPRYERSAPGTPLKARILRTAKWTFLARNRDGEMRPAYERFIAIPSAAGLSNIWRPASDTGPGHFAEHTAFGFAGHWGGNVWNEFWPDVKKRAFSGF